MEYTGGHVYPFLKLSEYLLQRCPEICKAKNRLGMMEEFSSAKFYDSEINKQVISRSISVKATVLLDCIKVLEDGDFSSSRTNSITRAGLWKTDSDQFISLYFQLHIFKMVKKTSESNSIDLDKREAIEDVILFGLKYVQESDFVDDLGTNQHRFENAIGTIFAAKLAKIPELHIAPQTQFAKANPSSPGSNPAVDFFLNGRLNIYLELVRNGDKIEKHFDRFEDEDGAYHNRQKGSDYAILDFNLLTTAPAAVPSKYQHVGHKFYTFVKQRNELHRGPTLAELKESNLIKSVIIKSNVSCNLPSPAKRQYSTLARSTFSSLLKFRKFLI
jgi:hypothetical protein